MSAWAAQPAQSVNHRGVAGTGGGAAQKAIDANPAHDARIGIALRFAAIFPQAVALVLPDALQMRDELTSHGERFGRRFDAGASHEVKRIEQFTHHVGLTLCGRVITDTHRDCTAIACEPRDLVLIDAPDAVDTVHDPHLVWRTANRPQHPVAPARGLVAIACVQQ